MSTKRIPAGDVLEEVESLREEIGDLLRELDSRRPTAALRLRARSLRKRLKAQGRTLEQSIAFEEGIAIVFRQRSGAAAVRRRPDQARRRCPRRGDRNRPLEQAGGTHELNPSLRNVSLVHDGPCIMNPGVPKVPRPALFMALAPVMFVAAAPARIRHSLATRQIPKITFCNTRSV